MARPQCDIALVSFWKVIYFIPLRPIWFPSNVFANTLIEGKRTCVLFIGGKKRLFLTLFQGPGGVAKEKTTN